MCCCTYAWQTLLILQQPFSAEPFAASSHFLEQRALVVTTVCACEAPFAPISANVAFKPSVPTHRRDQCQSPLTFAFGLNDLQNVVSASGLDS